MPHACVRDRSPVISGIRRLLTRPQNATTYRDVDRLLRVRAGSVDDTSDTVARGYFGRALRRRRWAALLVAAECAGAPGRVCRRA